MPFNIQTKQDLVTLHEVGHFTVLYALGLYPQFQSITNQSTGPGTLGLIDYDRSELAGIPQEISTCIKERQYSKLNYLTFEKTPTLCIKQIAVLLGGGAICRYYGVEDPYDLCKVDDAGIKGIVATYGLTEETLPALKTMADGFMKTIFMKYDSIIRRLYSELGQSSTIGREEMDDILNRLRKEFPGVL